MSKEDKTAHELAERRKADRRHASRAPAKVPRAEDLSSKAALYILEGTSEMEVDTIIQRIRQLQDDSEAK